VKGLEKRHLATHNQQSTAPSKAAKEKHLIEFTSGHVQLEWERGRWTVREWYAMETRHPTWIQPEENLLSALIRPPSRPEQAEPEPKLETERSREEKKCCLLESKWKIKYDLLRN